MMLNQSVCSMAALLLILAGCQRDEPPHKAGSGAAPTGGAEHGTPVVTDPQPVDVQVMKPVRQPLVYTITLWEVNATNQNAIFANLGYQFGKRFSLYAGRRAIRARAPCSVRTPSGSVTTA